MRCVALPAFSLAVLLLVAPSAVATWSIAAVDRATGEVAVAGATCLNGMNLERFLPVIRVGQGVGVAQAVVDTSCANRQVMWEGLASGLSPEEILAVIELQDASFHDRQIGMVDLQGRALTFTGNRCYDWAGGVTGTIGTISYAIQGNVLTGSPVVAAAERGFTEGKVDLPTRLMNAMEGARSMGGDGRCSCDDSQPTSCGSPPDNFLKSAHVGFIILARNGDLDGECLRTVGCASGEYFMNLNVKGNNATKPDPVFQFKDLFGEWRADWLGRPDHIMTEVNPRQLTLKEGPHPPADLKIVLRDWNGDRVLTPIQSITVTAVDPAGTVAVIGSPVAHGNGVYTVPVRPGGTLGRVNLKIVVDDGRGPVTLYPFVELSVAPDQALIANTSQVSSSQGDDLGLSMRGGLGLADRYYVILCSASGSSPGFMTGGVEVPLAFDPLVWFSFQYCGTAALPGTCGMLDGLGRAEAAVLLQPGDLAPLVSSSLTLAAVVSG
ncbi:MAG: DUF1028 domain-containing protein, partial [Planctomycetota bacterium]